MAAIVQILHFCFDNIFLRKYRELRNLEKVLGSDLDMMSHPSMLSGSGIVSQFRSW